MIRRPTTPLLLSLVRRTLANVPDLPASEQRETLALCDGILGICTRRNEHELAWMLEEIAQVEDLVSALGLGGHDPDGVLRATQDALTPVADLSPAEVPERYDACSEMLAQAIPLALQADAAVRQQLDAVIDLRIAHERDIRGDVRLVRD